MALLDFLKPITSPDPNVQQKGVGQRFLDFLGGLLPRSNDLNIDMVGNKDVSGLKTQPIQMMGNPDMTGLPRRKVDMNQFTNPINLSPSNPMQDIMKMVSGLSDFTVERTLMQPLNMQPRPTQQPVVQQAQVPQQQAMDPIIQASVALNDRQSAPVDNTNPLFFDFSPFMGTYQGEVPQPPEDIAKIIWEMFGDRNEATQAALAAYSENIGEPYNPRGYGWNSKGKARGTEDLGLFQVNTGQPENPELGYVSTLVDLLNRRMGQMRNIGVLTQEDLYDPRKNAQVARILREEDDVEGRSPWNRWYGWQNNGFDLNPLLQ